MPERVNEFTVMFFQGDRVIPELGWRAGRGPDRFFNRLEPKMTENFFTRAYPWNVVDGIITKDCIVNASEEEMNLYLSPLTNEYGVVSP